MARCVGDDESPSGRGEVPVRDVYRDALLALGFQSVSEKGQVRITAQAFRSLANRMKMVLVDRVGFVEQPPDQSGLAVINAPGSTETQELSALCWVIHRYSVVHSLCEDGVSRAAGATKHLVSADTRGAQKYPSRFFCSMDAS